MSVFAHLLERIRSLGPESDESDTDILPIAATTLLLEVAWADREVAPQELEAIRRALKDQFGLDDATIGPIIEESQRAYHESVDLYTFTRTIIEAWDEPRRFALVVALWRIAFADKVIDGFEEYTIRKIADLLYVSHARFIEAKQLARDGRAG